MFRKILILAGLLLTLWSRPGAALELVNAKAILVRGSNTKIRVSFRLNSISATDRPIYGLSNSTSALTQDEGTLMMVKYLDICAFDPTAPSKKCSEGPDNRKNKFTYLNNSNQDLTPETHRDLNLTAGFIDGATKFTVQEDDVTYQYMTTIIELTTPADRPFTVDTVVSLHLMYGSTANSPSAKDVEIDVTPSVAVNDVSDSFALTSTIKTIIATWTPDEELTMADTNKGLAEGAIAFAIPESEWGTRTFPLHTYDQVNPSAETKTDSFCKIEANANGLDCTVDCGAYDGDNKLYYLKVDDLKEVGINVSEAGNVGKIRFSGLSIGTNYAVVFQNQPDGLKRSCKIGQPSDAVTLGELSGGKEPVEKDPRCFIATAAYGSALDPHLDTLRWFRDNILMVTQPGERFVQTYYRYSPPLAQYIAQRPTLRALTRGVLWLPVLFLEVWRERPSLLLTLTAMSGTFLLLFLRRRSLRSLV